MNSLRKIKLHKTGEPMRIPSVGSVRAGVFKFCWIKKLMINIGLVLLQKESKYEASLYESFCLRRRSEVNLLPSGYPQRKPDRITMEPYSDT